uniref:ABC transporter domain-containing protein n=1 Tax=Strigamia maritima TaxID=126957 RepID=T1J7I5_STRMM
MGRQSEEVNSIFLKNKNAVEVEDIKKSYGNGFDVMHFRKKKTTILKGINLKIARGTIYGLLGPSGCGKTTLLRLLTGRLSPDSGAIRIFGSPVGSKESRIPGDGVGYMPQEIALYAEFTIKETLCYFGHVYDMSSSEVKKRTKFLLDLLHLSNESAVVKNLSGGQKRRVSFAVSLFQNARLLILDEPTVGVDPLIWNHLLTIVRENNVSVILTTHYIEEVRQADMVGMMRDGSILAEDTPNNLLARHESANLEDVFLKLCYAAEQIPLANGVSSCRFGRASEASENYNSSQISWDLVDNFEMGMKDSSKPIVNHASEDTLDLALNGKNHVAVKNPKLSSSCNFFISSHRTRAVISKNFIHLYRNIPNLGFQFIIPAIQLIIFCLSIGHKPTNLEVGLVNNDSGIVQFGQLFIDAIDNKTIILKKYDNIETALKAVEKNEIWGLIYISDEFSSNLFLRFMQFTHASEDVLQGSKVRVWLDKIDQQILYTLHLEMLMTTHNFVYSVLKKYNITPGVADLPISFESHANDGTMVENYMMFVAPGIILLICYYMAVALTNLAFVIEKKDGLMERIYVAGVTDCEIVLGFFVSQGFVMVVQIGIALLFLILVFDEPCNGPIFWVIVILILQGICGMFQGLLVSAIIDDEYLALFLQLAFFFPSLMLTGIVWPLQGIPTIFEYASYMMPQTFPVSALRALLLRGWVYCIFLNKFYVLPLCAYMMSRQSETANSIFLKNKSAVKVENITKSFGFDFNAIRFKKRKTNVLKGINLTIEKGSIYGLLGPSGCGKTTLLRLLTGRLLSDSGTIRIFGNPVGSKESRIPGDGVGYMPQEIALYSEFTIQETLIYFGHVYDMTASEVKKRTNFLLDLLHLPSESAVVKNLSIWNYLVKIVRENNVTVILTTHYIEEVRQADMVGMMRDGRILAEDTPNNLLLKFESANLEDVFVKLCYVADQLPHANGDLVDNFEMGIKATAKRLQNTNACGGPLALSFEERSHITVKNPKLSPTCICKFSINRTRAVFTKNIIHLYRSLPNLGFQFFVPALQLIVFCLSIGHKPAGLEVGLVNNDTGIVRFGHLFIEAIDNKTIILKNYDNVETALKAVENNEIWGLIYISDEFSSNLFLRFMQFTSASEEVLEGSKIRVWLDKIDQHILYVLHAAMLSTTHKFAYSVFKTYNISPSVADLPISFESHKNDETLIKNHTMYMAPGVLIIICYYMAVALTNLTFVIEKQDGLLERIYVAGLLMSALVDDEHLCLFLQLALLFPALMLSGTVWPLQGITGVMGYASYFMPQKFAVNALRSLLLRGWGIDYVAIWSGVLASVTWIGLFLGCTTVVLSVRK